MDQDKNGVIDYKEFTRVFKGKNEKENKKYFDRFAEGDDVVSFIFIILILIQS